MAVIKTPPTKITYNLPPTYLSLSLSPIKPPPITPIKEPIAVKRPTRVPISRPSCHDNLYKRMA